MTARPRDMHRSAADGFGSDFAKVDAHRLTQAEYDEMPELSDADLARAVPGNGASLLRSPDALRQPVTLHLDADVLAGLRATGTDWDERVNDVLRAWLRGREGRDA